VSTLKGWQATAQGSALGTGTPPWRSLKGCQKAAHGEGIVVFLCVFASLREKGKTSLTQRVKEERQASRRDAKTQRKTRNNGMRSSS
jgi:hypothetical protein